MNPPARIIHFSIADSDYYFKEILIKSLLDNPFYNLAKNCNNGHELISHRYFRYETVFLIDLYMPILSGMETIKYIRSTGNSTPVLTYSATFQEDMHTLLCSCEGVFYCQKKSMIIIDILKHCVLSQTKEYSEYIKDWAKQPLAVDSYMERKKKAWYEPTLTEIQIMKLCYEGLNSKEIAMYLSLTKRTVETYIANLTQKLGLRNKTDLIRFCVEQGFYNSGM